MDMSRSNSKSISMAESIIVPNRLTQPNESSYVSYQYSRSSRPTNDILEPAPFLANNLGQKNTVQQVP